MTLGISSLDMTPKLQTPKEKINKLDFINFCSFKDTINKKTSSPIKVQIGSYRSSHGDVKYSKGNTVNNIVSTMY